MTIPSRAAHEAPCGLPDLGGPCWGTVVDVGLESPPAHLEGRAARKWEGPTVARCAGHRRYEREGYRADPAAEGDGTMRDTG